MSGAVVVSRVALDNYRPFTLSARLERAAERPAERAAERAAERGAERAAERAAERGAERAAERRRIRDRLSAERAAERGAGASLQLSASTGPRPAERRRDRARIAAAQRVFTVGGRRAAGPVIAAELQIYRYTTELSRIVRRALVYAHGLSRIGRQVHETRGSRVFIIQFLQNCVNNFADENCWLAGAATGPAVHRHWPSRVLIIQFLQNAARSLRTQFSRQPAPARRSRSGANPGLVPFQ